MAAQNANAVSVSGPACLALADGAVFRGAACGARRAPVAGELCFNTSLSGYQEIITDPSYAGQMVVMTCAQIGNVGANSADNQAQRPRLRAFIAKEIAHTPSNFRAQESLPAFLARNGVPAITGIDTRALVRRIREGGFQNACLSTDPAMQEEKALLARAQNAPPLGEKDLVAEVTCKAPYKFEAAPWPGIAGALPPPPRPKPLLRLAAFDFGVKREILWRLAAHGFETTVVPARTSAAAIGELKPDAVFLSNGPGDPAAVRGVRKTVRELARAYPLFGICLGHQILALALGGETRKLRFGHHGGNQPGQDSHTGKVAICAENHGYAVIAESMQSAGEAVEITHTNLNDGTVEGLAHQTLPLFSVQYHPEAAPGPHDADYFFARFREMALRHKRGQTVTGAQIARGGGGGAS